MVNKTLSLFFMLFLVLAAHQAVMKAEARVCQSQSHGFKGKCFSDHNCALVCKNERFSGGKCRGFRQRCFCTKGC